MKKFFIGFVAGILSGYYFLTGILKKIESPKILKKKEEERKRIMEKWLICWLRGYTVNDLLLSKRISKVVIYGAADFGAALKKSICSQIECCCFIDRDKSKNVVSDVNVMHDFANVPTADVIIITAFDPYREIKVLIEEKLDIDVIYLEELIDEMYMESLEEPIR